MPEADSLPPEFVLPDFEGHLVTRAAIEIPGAAGGLREAMQIEPRALHQGDLCYVLLECNVGKLRHDPIDDKDLGGPMSRVHILKARAGTIMDPEVAKPAVDAQKERIQLAKEEALGVQRLDLDDAVPDPSSSEATDADGFVDMSLVRKRLNGMTKEELRALCDKATPPVEYTKSASGQWLVDALVEEVPNLAEMLPPIGGED